MSDYSFMKTGINTELEDTDSNIESDVVTMVSTFANEGLKHAARYVEHHNTRNYITPEDIKRGMMLEVFLFNKRPDLLEKFEEIKELIDDDTEDDDIDDNNIQNEIIDDMQKEEEFSVNNCDCAICKCMTTIYTRWAKWSPSTPMEIILKRNIDKIESK